MCEPSEATPAYDCPLCVEAEGRGHVRSDCWRCNGTHRLGVEGPLPAGVALDENDRARFYPEGSLREAGEAVMPLHLCPQVAAA